MASKKKCKVFVSYSRHDEALVRPLAGLLGVASDDAVFLDVTSLRPGQLWEKEIFDALKEASVFILCWCCESEKSHNVAKEIAAALSDGSKKLVPVLFCGAPLPTDLKARQWTDLRGKIVHECPVPHVAEKTGRKDQESVNDRIRSSDASDYESARTRWQKYDANLGASVVNREAAQAAPIRSSAVSKPRKYVIVAAVLFGCLLVGFYFLSSFSSSEPPQSGGATTEIRQPEHEPDIPSTGSPTDQQSSPPIDRPSTEVLKGPTVHTRLPHSEVSHGAAHGAAAPGGEDDSVFVMPVIIVGFIVLVAFLARKLYWAAPKRIEIPADEIAANAKSYFESLSVK